MRGDTRCIDGRVYEHRPQQDDPDLEVVIGQCPECDGEGCDRATAEPIEEADCFDTPETQAQAERDTEIARTAANDIWKAHQNGSLRYDDIEETVRRAIEKSRGETRQEHSSAQIGDLVREVEEALAPKRR